MVVGDSPLLLISLLLVKIHLFPGIYLYLRAVEHRLRRVEAVYGVLVIDIFVHKRGLLFDRHLILYGEAVLLTLDNSLKALDLEGVLIGSGLGALVIGVRGQHVDEGLVYEDIFTYFVVDLIVRRDAVVDLWAEFSALRYFLL